MVQMSGVHVAASGWLAERLRTTANALRSCPPAMEVLYSIALCTIRNIGNECRGCFRCRPSFGRVAEELAFDSVLHLQLWVLLLKTKR